MAGEKKRKLPSDADAIDDSDQAQRAEEQPNSRRRRSDVNAAAGDNKDENGSHEEADQDADSEYQWLKSQLKLQQQGGEQGHVLSLALSVRDHAQDEGEEHVQDEEGEEEAAAEEEPEWDDGCSGKLKLLLSGAASGSVEHVQQALAEHPAGAAGTSNGGAHTFINGAAPDGDTALHLASLFGHAEVVQTLLSHGADAGTLNKEDGSTPLHDAAASGEAGILQQLLKAAPQVVNVADSDGDTALHNAARGGHLECCKLLLEAGADKTLKNAEGHTPAQEADEAEVVSVLE